MGSVYEVEKGLPPGLWLPTAEESVDQYRLENFNHNDHPYEKIVDYGAFMVALAMLGVNEHPRDSFMPTRYDAQAMYDAGFGMSLSRLHTHYGGIGRLQQTLGYYPDHFEPAKEELIERCMWMARYAVDLDRDFGPTTSSIESILAWGTTRDILPSKGIIYLVMPQGTIELQKIFGVEKPSIAAQYTHLDVYKFGEKVIRENGGPLKQADLDERYRHLFLETPYSIILAFFGTMNNFWQEFGYVANSQGFSRDDILNLGVQHAIKTDGGRLTKDAVMDLSRQKRFPSMSPIQRHFGGIVRFREEVEMGYQEYLVSRDELMADGVSEEMVKLACQRFETGVDFGLELKRHLDSLVTLSSDQPACIYVRTIIKNGFDLGHDETFNMQLTDVKNALRIHGFAGADKRFVFGLIPRVNVDEILTKPGKAT